MLIVKVGGGDLDLEGIARDLAALERPFVLVHGANKLRDEMAVALGRPPQVVESVSGYTSVLSDDDAIDVLLAAYAGVRNKRLVEALRRAGVDAIGLTGLDGGLVRGERNRGIRVERDGRRLLLRDQSGKPRAVHGRLLRSLLAAGHVPVLTVPIAGEDGSALNTENDEVLALLAAELRPDDVVSLMEAPGLLRDRDDPTSLVESLDASELEAWEARVEGRMRRKIRALRSLFEKTSPAPRVVLADGRVEEPVSSALAGRGTTIRAAAAPEPADAADWSRRQARHELDVYGKRGPVLVRGRGAMVWDAEGRAYVDCIGGHGALPLGHGHAALEAALGVQSEQIWFVPGSFATPTRARYLERLHATLPSSLARTFLSNSGAEAVEAALKIARANTERPVFVAAMRGFHGRTLGALSVTAERRYREPFAPLLESVRHVPFGDVERLADVVDEQVAAILLEPVQGEGGVHVAPPEYLRAARRIADETGALLVFDEVQTGFGRTGRMFAFEHAGVVPDVLCLAKGIAGGLPLGATVVREGLTLPLGAHGSTFGGNPVAVAVAEATLETLLDTTDGDLVRSAEEKGRRLADALRSAALPAVREVRQVGLMIGIQLRRRVRDDLAALQERGVLALAAGATVLRLLPPLVITPDELDRVAAALLEVLARD